MPAPQNTRVYSGVQGNRAGSFSAAPGFRRGGLGVNRGASVQQPRAPRIYAAPGEGLAQSSVAPARDPVAALAQRQWNRGTPPADGGQRRIWSRGGGGGDNSLADRIIRGGNGGARGAGADQWHHRDGNSGGTEDWRNRHGNGDWAGRNRGGSGGSGDHWNHDWDRGHHHRDWWRSRYTRFALFGGGYYYWNSGYWYPAYGYDPYFSTYTYDAPIYSYNDLQPGQVLADVQAELARRGYYDGPIDGVYGGQTQEALLRFQRDADLPESGIIDSETLDALGYR